MHLSGRLAGHRYGCWLGVHFSAITARAAIPDSIIRNSRCTRWRVVGRAIGPSYRGPAIYTCAAALPHNTATYGAIGDSHQHQWGVGAYRRLGRRDGGRGFRSNRHRSPVHTFSIGIIPHRKYISRRLCGRRRGRNTVGTRQPLHRRPYVGIGRHASKYLWREHHIASLANEVLIGQVDNHGLGRH